ncbi:glycosyltransferase [Mucilaginibacter sp. RS28]|uniref:Glycosyltransferase n=1 Tax=Mucilaginibacter straminoryzae TaxID=2932774 RepID=A0A9X1X4E4_9SPHI|nr:glycosyltransferase [Mucilaginibacter straminoryzae]MCJ8211012.1 glycosyltransferase [Mucilaginibacter straminoryzae]
MPKLSVIVPVYNKECYIDECINSILNQSFTDFELILVNDGSTDNSGQKCHDYATKDSRVIVIDQQNGGPSAARNTGIKKASGTYIGFIDSDDTISADMYELLYQNALKFDADISVCRLQTVFPNKVLKPAEKHGAVILDHAEALKACLSGELDRSANNKIYRFELIKPIGFEGHIYEDILFTAKAFLGAKRTAFENVVCYNYLVRDNSASMSAFNPKYLETISVSAKIVGLVKSEDKAVIIEAQKFDIVANISLLNLLLLVGTEKYPDAYERVIRTLRSYQKQLVATASLAAKHKYALKLFWLSPKLYTTLMYWYCRFTNAEAVKRTQNNVAVAS